ncbi:hypothetical protein QTL95_17915 [Rhizobium sp. S152]|uniref:hypothetical protein n=1 Tax=Rhizobium sp. S152 TaxID=3055038 RepID=UPI0025A9E5DC|nr:hypothetical protein [Rhizobium sp. S152]MDM9627772.1 hypothetical protein [Rhizobium sp. S152]
MSSSPHQTASVWVAATPAGEAIVRFSDANDFGVLDHCVKLEGKAALRMIANGKQTEIELVLFRLPEMSDEDFDRDAGMVERDLSKLKSLLESQL